jgi:hypothetical protein
MSTNFNGLVATCPSFYFFVYVFVAVDFTESVQREFVNNR